MGQAVKLNGLETVLEDLDYPITQTAAVDQCDDVTLILAEGEVNLGETVADSGGDTFESMDDLETEVFNLLPRNAVGEPYQSEGEG
ncbi:DUF5789 family protein [Natronorubrum sulfidifaciens]|uniref:Uncharacterized protein n=1 Tax=Natronorubrum sulfidifaciens JCM 14089 TaxID=1230460 RepID=L9VZN4_9EURY|nr:hypothetical protein [Natronorubrum sulfidifaciens]ELY42532.1 hypothetical protein C495_14502 [Natronorubrum sulfidifaciens JCM 14089]